MLSRSYLCAALFPLAACVSSPRITPVQAERPVAVEYRAAYAPQSAERVEPAKDPRPAALAGVPEHSEVSCEFVAIDARDLQAFAVEGGPFGCVVSRAEYERVRVELAERGNSAPISAPKLVLADGGRGDIAVTNEAAFVRAFKLERAGNSLVADPEVAVAHEGVRFDARSTRTADGAFALELALTTSRLVRPFAETSVQLGDGFTPFTLQIPIAFDQRLTANAALHSDEVLVLGGLFAGETSRALIAFVRTRAVAPGEALAAR